MSTYIKITGNGKLADFELAKFPVTNAEYREFMEFLRLPNNAAFEKSLREYAEKIEGFSDYLSENYLRWERKLLSTYDNDRRFNGDDHPVVGVSWYAASAYCYWLTYKNNNGHAYRLPTEAEWEWAASGGVRKYPWGNEKPDKARANYGDNVGHTTTVGAYPAGATPEGVMDMAGNVWEWCEDFYSESKYTRVLRGGAWISQPPLVSCAFRGNLVPVSRVNRVGFRCART